MANVNRKCLYCKQNKPKADGLILPVGFFCCHEHAVKYAYDRQQKQFAREKARQEKAKRKADREAKIAARPRSWYLAEAQRWFNRFIRLRDADEHCICCGRHKNSDIQWHAGHFLTTKSRPDLRFNEDNCHKQTSYCNKHLSGNVAEYRKRLADKIGIVRVESLENNRGRSDWNIEELKLIIDKYKDYCKALMTMLLFAQTLTYSGGFYGLL